MIGPELGVTQPGMTIVCGDSHTSTHGAFGALAFGIGTSEVEHVLATQTLMQKRPKTMRISYSGELGNGVYAKDLILATIGKLGTGGMVGHAVEYAGETMAGLSMENRMTICNMTIEGGGRAGMIAPDETTFEWVEGRPAAPKDFDAAVARWRELPTEDGATFDTEVEVNAAEISPMVTWGTNPGQVVQVTDSVPEPTDEVEERALRVHGAQARHAHAGDPARAHLHRLVHQLADRRPARGGVDGRRAARLPRRSRRWSSPARFRLKQQAEAEGLDEVFRAAGFDWRSAGCSMCLGMNPDILSPGERCASTSNRNFEGRQGKGGRTHLVSPKMAAAAAIEGHFVDIRDWS